jgi:hypothetical protein
MCFVCNCVKLVLGSVVSALDLQQFLLLGTVSLLKTHVVKFITLLLFSSKIQFRILGF